jgi:hypothetical protein
MKRNNIIAITGFLAAVALASCTDKLERFPYSSIELSQSFKTVNDAKTWNNGLYAQLRGRVYGLYTYSTDVQGDQLNASLDYGNRNGNPHRWEGFLSDDYTIRDIWQGYYSGINNLNIAIEGFKTIVPKAGQETTDLNKYKGDAHLARAYYYHRLVLRWAKAYEPATAATDLAVPLVTVYDVAAKPPRVTVKAIYDQIISDINEAKTQLAAVAGKQGATRFTKHVVTALEARVKLDMHDWAGAKAAAEELITAGTYPLINTQAEMLAMWKDDLPKEVIYQPLVTKPNELANTNGIYLGLVAQTGKFTPDFIPSKWVVDFYDNADFRKAAYFSTKTLTIQGADYPNIVLVNKYQGNPALFTAATTNYQNTPKLFRIAEMYLISAEAGARAGAATEAAALARLNELRVARGLTALVGLSGAPLFQAIKDERFRELAFEGFRLDDLKRWHEGFTRRLPQNTTIITTGANYEGKTIAADADKFVWGLPTNDVTINPNLKPQNQGW